MATKSCIPGSLSNPCEPVQFAQNTDLSLFDDIAASAIELGGAPLDVYKLLGIATMIDPQNVTGRGVGIGSPHIPGFGPDGPFRGTHPFRTQSRGHGVISDAFLGYDFGNITMPDGTVRGRIDQYAFRPISQLTLNQSHCVEWTASKVRVEYSLDGERWRGAATIEVSPGLGTYSFPNPAEARFWRIRPVEFRGTTTNEFWEVQSAHFSEAEGGNINLVQDKVLFENRNRDYQTSPIRISGRYEQQDSMLESFAVGAGISQTLTFEVSFAEVVSKLGRPLVIGDIIGMPNEAMYDQNMQRVDKFVEVTDVAWSTTSYTPNWTPTMLRVTTAQAISSVETRQLFGESYTNAARDGSYFEDLTGLPGSKTQDYDPIVDAIKREAKQAVPKKGLDQSMVGQPTLAEQQKVANEIGAANVAMDMKPQRGMLVEDAYPPNGEPYTESTSLPASGTDGQFHRVIYTGLADNIPARLYRYSGVKGRWIFCEIDKRDLYGHASPLTQPVSHK